MNDQHSPSNLPSYLRPELMDDALASIALWDAETALLLHGHRPNSANDDNDVSNLSYQEAA
jgi:hypothetical protein